MKILVTGFDPFGDDKINPAIEAVKRLPDEIGGAKIVKLEIPTKFNVSAEVVHDAIVKEKPDYVLSIGQAGGRYELTPERVAINLDDGRIKDNAGYQPLNHTIHEDQLKRWLRQSEKPVFPRRFQIQPAPMSATIFSIKCSTCAIRNFQRLKRASCTSRSYLNKLLHGQRLRPCRLKMTLKALPQPLPPSSHMMAKATLKPLKAKIIN